MLVLEPEAYNYVLLLFLIKLGFILIILFKKIISALFNYYFENVIKTFENKFIFIILYLSLLSLHFPSTTHISVILFYQKKWKHFNEMQ